MATPTAQASAQTSPAPTARRRYRDPSMLILVAVLSAAPNIVQSVYWQAGLTSYGLALSLLAVLVLYLIRGQT